MAILQSTGHGGPALLDGAVIDANFAAVNIASVTSEERETMAHEEGQIVYDTDLHKLCVCAGEAWEVLAAAPVEGPVRRAGPPNKHD